MKNLSAPGFLYVQDGGQVLFSPIENDYPKIVGLIRNDNVRGSFRVEDLLVLLVGKEETIYVIPQAVVEEYLDPVGGLKKALPQEYFIRNWYSENGGVSGRPVVFDDRAVDTSIVDMDGYLVRGGNHPTKVQRRMAYSEREVIENQFGVTPNAEIIRLPIEFTVNSYDSENMASLKRALNKLRIFVDRGQATYLRTIFKKINDGTITDKQHSELCRILNLKSKIEYFQTERL